MKRGRLKTKDQMKTSNYTVPKRYITTAEAMNYMGVSRDTLERLRVSGEIVAHKISSKFVRYDAASIDRFMARNIERY